MYEMLDIPFRKFSVEVPFLTAKQEKSIYETGLDYHLLELAMTIQGISHLTFVVRDLDRTAELLSIGLGAKEVYDSKGMNFSLSREKFFLLGGIWLAFMEGELTERSYRHVAFEVAEEDLPSYEDRLRRLGIEIKVPRPRIEGEGRSLYFYDYDNNLFELHTGTLEQRLARYTQ